MHKDEQGTGKVTKNDTEHSRATVYRVDAQGFPATREELDKLELVRRLGGSTGADLVRAPDGSLFVRKGTKKIAPEHLRSECQADAFYLAAGVSVPQFRLYDDRSEPTKLSKYIADAVPLYSWLRKASERKQEEMGTRLRRDLPIDILLSNWDVVGLCADNILVDKQGTPYRIDNGGALEFRAQGAKKTREEWSANGNIDDLWTMTGNGEKIDLYVKSTIPEYLGQADVFDMVNELLARQYAWRLGAKNPLGELSPENRAVVKSRLAAIRELANWGNRCVRVPVKDEEERGFILPPDVKLSYYADLKPVQYGYGLCLLCYHNGYELFGVSQKSWMTSLCLRAGVCWHEGQKHFAGLLGETCVDPRIVMMHILAGKLMLMSAAPRAGIDWEQAQKEINAVLPSPTIDEAEEWLEKNRFTGENAISITQPELLEGWKPGPGWSILTIGDISEDIDFEYLTPKVQALYDRYKRLWREKESKQN